MYDGLIPLVSMCSYRSLKTQMNYLSDLAFMGRIKILLLLYSQSTNIYLFPLFEVTGNLPIKSAAIFLLWLMILVNTVLVHCASGVIGGSSSFIGSCCLLDFIFFLVWCMWILAVSIDGGRCLLIISIFKLGHEAKDTFLIDWMRVYLNGLNSLA